MANSGNTNGSEDTLLNEVHKKVSVLQELYIEFFATLIPGFVMTLSILVLLFLFHFFAYDKLLFTEVLSKNLNPWLGFVSILVFSYTCGAIIYRKDLKKLDRISSFIQWIKQDEKSQKALAVHYPPDFDINTLKYDTEKSKLFNITATEYPYGYLRRYLVARGLYHLLIFVPWCYSTVNSIANSDDNIQTHIIPNYVKTLKKLKSKATAKDFHVYNALLALLALQAEKLMDGTLDEHSIQTIKSHAPKRLQGMGIEIIIQSKVEDILGHTYGHSAMLLKQMNFDLFAKDKSGIKFIRELSGLDKIIEKLENAVVEQKAKSILIDNGSDKVIELLKQVEADLQVVEQAALSDEEKVKADFEAAERKLQQFETFCEDELEILDDAIIDRSLALDYWEQVIVASIDEVAEKAAIRISNVHLNEVRQDVNEQIVNEVFSEVVLPKATNWANDIRSGENTAFNSLMDSKIKKIIRNTEKEWELLLEEQPILSGLPVPTPVIGSDVMATDFVDSVVAKTPGINKDVWIGSATGFAIGATIGSFVFPGIGTLVGGVLGGALGAAAGDGIGTDRRENFIKEELKKELTQNIVLGDNSESETKRSILNKQEKRIRVLREGVIGAFEAAFADTQSAFLTRQSEALKIYKLETAQRTALAKKHTELRTVQIEPLRKKIETYERSFGCSGGTDGTDVNIASVDNKTPFSAVAEEQNLWMDCGQKDEESDVICIDPAKVAAGLAEINIDRTKGIKFSADGRILERYSPNLPDNIYHIPYGITAIAPDAFADCDNIESVVIPDSVICIGERAFKYSGLEEIVLPGSLKKISAESFAGCWYLKKVVILQGVTEIEPQAFCGCSALDTVIIPESITKIASDAFLNSPCERSIMERYGSLFSTTGNG